MSTSPCYSNTVFQFTILLFQAIAALIKASEGDLRKAITYLQSAHRLKGDDGITENDIFEIAGVRY